MIPLGHTDQKTNRHYDAELVTGPEYDQSLCFINPSLSTVVDFEPFLRTQVTHAGSVQERIGVALCF